VRFAILPLVLTLVAMLEADSNRLQGPSHHLPDRNGRASSSFHFAIRHVKNVLLSTVE